MIKEDYVSLEVAKLLKERGFREWCSYFYGTAVQHNGEDIDEDEEYELKAEGRGDEIEYIEGGHLYHFNCNNSKEDINIWACPTQSLATKWLREIYDIFIVIRRGLTGTGWVYSHEIYKDSQCWHAQYGASYNTYEEAVEKALKFSLEKLIK